MSLRRPSSTLLVSALAVIALSACATSPAPEAAKPSAPVAAAPPAAKPAAPMAAAPAATKPVERPAAFAICAACHGAAANAPPGLGPNLFGIAGKPAGTAHPDFDYSDALKKSGKVWTSETLAAFLQDPGKYIPDNNMDYPGVPDAATAKAIADYTVTLK